MIVNREFMPICVIYCAQYPQWFHPRHRSWLNETAYKTVTNIIITIGTLSSANSNVNMNICFTLMPKPLAKLTIAYYVYLSHVKSFRSYYAFANHNSLSYSYDTLKRATVYYRAGGQYGLSEYTTYLMWSVIILVCMCRKLIFVKHVQSCNRISTIAFLCTVLNSLK